MKRIVRKNVFETNSSSTHAMSICLEGDIDTVPSHLKVKGDYFGWEHEVISKPERKINYLYTCLIINAYYEFYSNEKMMIRQVADIQNNLYDKLNELGCDAEFDSAKDDVYRMKHSQIDIDHGDDVSSTYINQALNHLDKFLDHRSLIITGNDNSNMDVKEELNKKMKGINHFYSFKWN